MDADIRRVDGPAPTPRTPRSRPRRRGEDEEGAFDEELRRHAGEHADQPLEKRSQREKKEERAVAPPPDDESGSNLDLIG